jgi:hypothetical protein
MHEPRSKTYYRPPTGHYEGLPLIVRPEDRKPNTVYRPLVRIGKGIAPSEDPADQKRHKRIFFAFLLGFFIAMILISLVLSYR